MEKRGLYGSHGISKRVLCNIISQIEPLIKLGNGRSCFQGGLGNVCCSGGLNEARCVLYENYQHLGGQILTRRSGLLRPQDWWAGVIVPRILRWAQDKAKSLGYIARRNQAVGSTKGLLSVQEGKEKSFISIASPCTGNRMSMTRRDWEKRLFVTQRVAGSDIMPQSAKFVGRPDDRNHDLREIQQAGSPSITYARTVHPIGDFVSSMSE
ncbi:hypothetical protein BX600DRAFT_434174 [Xylariales sp. PMI_506]|nr:hypothetical protein BX600DRAFT_434174 [Xylariales sp. PMI_506]